MDDDPTLRDATRDPPASTFARSRLSASNSPRKRYDPSPQRSPVYRTNFGKSKTYTPPFTDWQDKTDAKPIQQLQQKQQTTTNTTSSSMNSNSSVDNSSNGSPRVTPLTAAAARKLQSRNRTTGSSPVMSTALPSSGAPSPVVSTALPGPQLPPSTRRLATSRSAPVEHYISNNVNTSGMSHQPFDESVFQYDDDTPSDPPAHNMVLHNDEPPSLGGQARYIHQSELPSLSGLHRHVHHSELPGAQHNRLGEATHIAVHQPPSTLHTQQMSPIVIPQQHPQKRVPSPHIPANLPIQHQTSRKNYSPPRSRRSEPLSERPKLVVDTADTRGRPTQPKTRLSVSEDEYTFGTKLSEPVYVSDHQEYIRKQLGANHEEVVSDSNIGVKTSHGILKNKLDDEDSLFDFSHPQHKNNKGRRRVARRDRGSQSDDDDDDEEDDVSPSLQERTQAAWKRKSAQRAATASPIQKPSISTASSRTESVDPDKQPDLSSPVVSFGGMDTIHHFEPDTYDDVDNDHGTLADTSLESEYTKSLESEVEDAIKDIFMIGNGNKPGRRKVRYSSGGGKKDSLKHSQDQSKKAGINIKSELTMKKNTTANFQEEKKYDEQPLNTQQPEFDHDPKNTSMSENDTLDDDDTFDDGTFTTYDDNSITRPVGSSAKVGAKVDEKKKEDPLYEAWSFVESGFSAVGLALGLDPQSSQQCGSPTKRNTTEKSPTDKKNFFDYATDVLLGPSASSLCEKPVRSVNKTNTNISEPEPEEVPVIPSLEEDERLIELAIQAARSAHRLQGYVFDESYEINIVEDIEFHVVDLQLPLGIVFQENEGGCWVTRVVQNGNASKTNIVKLGDQLAAIDGLSAVHLKVDEIADLIRACEGEVELTFLRYVGSIHPAAGELEEEGYEVKATGKANQESMNEDRSLSKSSLQCTKKLLPISKPEKSGFDKAMPEQSTGSMSSKKSGSQATTKSGKSAERRKFSFFGRRKNKNK